MQSTVLEKGMLCVNIWQSLPFLLKNLQCEENRFPSKNEVGVLH